MLCQHTIYGTTRVLSIAVCWSSTGVFAVCSNQSIGLLSAPTNLQASRPSSSAIHLYWDPPFTLDITNVDPDIPGYTVSITNNNTKVTSERNVTKPEFLFQEYDHDPCHVYLFRVSAWNPVGVGEPSDVIDECFGGGW